MTLSACSSVPQVDVDLPKQPCAPAVPEPRPISSVSVDFQQIQSNGALLIGLDQESYNALLQNIAESVRWIKEARAQLNYYRQSLENC